MDLKKITKKLIGCVNKILGPGFLESVYKESLTYDLTNAGRMVELQTNNYY